MRLWRERIERDGVALAVLRGPIDPARPSLLFVNAVGMAAGLAGRLAPAIGAAGFNFVTWELRGSPGGGRRPADYALEAHVRDGLTILSRLGIPVVAVAGWCTGASVALFLAERLGALATSLVLVDGALLFDGRPGRRFGDAMYAMCGDIVADPAAARRYLDIVAPRGGEAAMLGLEGEDEVLGHVLAPYSGGVERLIAYAFAIRAACDYNPREICRSIRCPTLLLAQTGDLMVSHRNSEIAAGLIADSELRLFAGGNHTCLFTQRALPDAMIGFVNARSYAL